MSQIFIVTFNDLSSYKKYKKEVIEGGGAIKNDLGETLLGFTAVFPPSLVELICSGSLTDNGIASFEADGVAAIQ